MNPHAIDTDERPFVLIWEVTQACGLTCKHCRADAQPDRHPDELSTEEGYRLLDAARRFGDGQLVVLSGGDPLMREDLVDLVRYGVDNGLQMTLTPSGTDQLTPAVIDDLADAGLRRLAVSLDGATAAAHDDFRGETGSFTSTMTAAQHARDARLPLQINTTVCVETVEELPAIADLVADLDAVLWSVFFLVPVGRGTVLEQLDPEYADRVMEWLVDLDVPFGIKTTEAPQYRRVALQTADSTDDRRPRKPDAIGRSTGITAGDGFAFVSHTGELFPSGFLPYTAGNVRDTDLVELYRNSDLFTALRNRNALTGKCGACPYRMVCGGSRSRAFAATGDPLASDPLCPYVPEGYDGPLPNPATPTQ